MVRPPHPQLSEKRGESKETRKKKHKKHGKLPKKVP
jgi:hypothetical protein